MKGGKAAQQVFSWRRRRIEELRSRQLLQEMRERRERRSRWTRRINGCCLTTGWYLTISLLVVFVDYMI